MILARLGARIGRLHPFTTRYASNLAILFGMVYFYAWEADRCDRCEAR